ncbi:hypothetical protein KUF71_012826 [Frankliniella fusca]|uniref:Uncharacterized protein n=1 Tax=Frankliniella fusca TaxID=407009 RepID=A0AAE1HNS8_9NEOP|nr:hypothetical protein KUF71_012826 [Frankliniella fusca]
MSDPLSSVVTHSHPSLMFPLNGRSETFNGLDLKIGSEQVGEQIECAGQVWDGPLHNQQQSHYQQPVPSSKRKLSANKTHHIEHYDDTEEMGKIEVFSDKSPVQNMNQANTKISMGRKLS